MTTQTATRAEWLGLRFDWQQLASGKTFTWCVRSLWTLGLVVALAWQTRLGLEYRSNETTNFALQLARAAAYDLLVLFALLWLPVMRHARSWLQRFRWSALLPLETGKELHRWLGHGLMAIGVLHGLGYLIYFATLPAPFLDTLFGREPDLVRSMETTMYEFVSDDRSIEAVRQWIASGASPEGYHADIAPIMQEDCTKCHSAGSTMTYAVPSLPLTSYEEVRALSDAGVASRQFRIDVAGISLLVLFLIVWASSLKAVRRRFFHWYQELHRLGYVIAIVGLIHVPRFEYLVVPAIVLAAELYLGRYRHLWRDACATAHRLSDDLVELAVTIPEQINFRPGYYVQVCVPQIHRREWHAFSLTGSSVNARGETELQLVIKVQGDWTQQLADRLATQPVQPFALRLRGHFSSPMAKAVARPNAVLIAGGVGITPVLSVLNAAHAKHRAPLHVIWVFRNWALYRWVEAALHKCQRLSTIHCFASGGAAAQEGSLPVKPGRPDWQQLFRDLAARHDQPLDVFVCGPSGMIADVRHWAGERHGWRVYEEKF